MTVWPPSCSHYRACGHWPPCALQIVMATYNGGNTTPEFNNAGQIWNHDFYWQSLSPKPSAPLPCSLTQGSRCRACTRRGAGQAVEPLEEGPCLDDQAQH